MIVDGLSETKVAIAALEQRLRQIESRLAGDCREPAR